MRLFGRVAALLVVLAVPLALALASQGLAARPGPPVVPPEPVRLVGPVAASTSATTAPSPGGTPGTAGPGQQPGTAGPGQPSGTAPGPPPGAGPGPRVVTPDVQRDDQDDQDDQDDDAPDGDDGDD